MSSSVGAGSPLAAYKKRDSDRVGECCFLVGVIHDHVNDHIVSLTGALDCSFLAGSTHGNDSDENERVHERRANVEVREGLGRRHVGKDGNKRREIDVKSDTSFPILF
jgi:hypothetical protein